MTARKMSSESRVFGNCFLENNAENLLGSLRKLSNNGSNLLINVRDQKCPGYRRLLVTVDGK